MRRVISIALIGSLLLPLAGSYLYLQHRPYALRKQMKRLLAGNLPDEALVILSIPRAWEENGHPDYRRFDRHEFRYRGIMYDIVRQESRGDTTLYWCLRDTEETELFSDLDQWLEQAGSQDPLQRQSREKLIDFLRSLFFPASKATPIDRLTTADRRFPTCRALLPSFFPHPPTPPPEA